MTSNVSTLKQTSLSGLAPPKPSSSKGRFSRCASFLGTTVSSIVKRRGEIGSICGGAALGAVIVGTAGAAVAGGIGAGCIYSVVQSCRKGKKTSTTQSPAHPLSAEQRSINELFIALDKAANEANILRRDLGVDEFYQLRRRTGLVSENERDAAYLEPYYQAKRAANAIADQIIEKLASPGIFDGTPIAKNREEYILHIACCTGWKREDILGLIRDRARAINQPIVLAPIKPQFPQPAYQRLIQKVAEECAKDIFFGQGIRSTVQAIDRLVKITGLEEWEIQYGLYSKLIDAVVALCVENFHSPEYVLGSIQKAVFIVAKLTDRTKWSIAREIAKKINTDLLQIFDPETGMLLPEAYGNIARNLSIQRRQGNQDVQLLLKYAEVLCLSNEDPFQIREELLQKLQSEAEERERGSGIMTAHIASDIQAMQHFMNINFRGLQLLNNLPDNPVEIVNSPQFAKEIRYLLALAEKLKSYKQKLQDLNRQYLRFETERTEVILLFFKELRQFFNNYNHDSIHVLEEGWREKLRAAIRTFQHNKEVINGLPANLDKKIGILAQAATFLRPSHCRAEADIMRFEMPDAE